MSRYQKPQGLVSLESLESWPSLQDVKRAHPGALADYIEEEVKNGYPYRPVPGTEESKAIHTRRGWLINPKYVEKEVERMHKLFAEWDKNSSQA
jgi:hypothetical protein